MSEGNDITRGERGPKGDHGQPGEAGLVGEAGETGHEGAKGERGDTGPEGKSSLLGRHVSVSFALIVIATSLVLAGFGYAISQNRNLLANVNRQQNEIQRIARETHNSLCTFKADLTQRRDSSVTYLKEHPRGVVSPATNAVIITPAEIQQSIDNQNATLKSLSALSCDP